MALKPLTRGAERRAADAEAQAARGQTPQQVRDTADALYDRLRQGGVQFDASQTVPLYTALHDMRNAGRFDVDANPQLRGFFDRALRESRGPMDYQQLQQLRSLFSTEARDSANSASTRAAANEMLGHIDGIIRGPAPAINPHNLDLSQLHPEAGRGWRSAILADEVGWIGDKAERKAQWKKTGVDPDEAMRSNLAALQERVNRPQTQGRPAAVNPFTPEENRLLDRAVSGTPLQNRLGAAGSALERGGNIAGITTGALGTIAGLTQGSGVGPSIATAMGIPVKYLTEYTGRALNRGAANIGRENLADLLREITRSPPPVPGAATNRGDLAQIIFGRDLARLGGQAPSGER